MTLTNVFSNNQVTVIGHEDQADPSNNELLDQNHDKTVKKHRVSMIATVR